MPSHETVHGGRKAQDGTEIDGPAASALTAAAPAEESSAAAASDVSLGETSTEAPDGPTPQPEPAPGPAPEPAPELPSAVLPEVAPEVASEVSLEAALEAASDGAFSQAATEAISQAARAAEAVEKGIALLTPDQGRHERVVKAAWASDATPDSAMEATEKILRVCVSRTEARKACEAAAPREADAPWGDTDVLNLERASEAFKAAKARLVVATQALRDKTAQSNHLLDAVGTDIVSYRERKERWNMEVDTLVRTVEEASAEEEWCRGAMRELEEARVRAAATRSREVAIRSEAAALELKKDLMDAIRAIEQLQE